MFAILAVFKSFLEEGSGIFPTRKRHPQDNPELLKYKSEATEHV